LELATRNRLIYEDFLDGKAIVDISKEHYLSEWWYD